MRQIVLDTETTGIEISQGNRVIEIGCVELENRRLTGRHYHQYINPERDSEEGALAIHGITTEFLQDKPLFADIAEDFLHFVKGAELVIHNAAFDVGFLNHEFGLLAKPPAPLQEQCKITDSLALAKEKHPGQKNNLDALCKRYGIDNSMRDLHGALLDAQILAEVYLMLTGGQTSLSLYGQGAGGGNSAAIRRLSAERKPLTVIAANAEELAAHEARLDAIADSAGQVVWRGTE